MADRQQASSKDHLPAQQANPDSPGTPHPTQDKTDLQMFLQYTLPKFLAKNVDRLLLVLVVLAALWWVWNYRNNSIRQATADVNANASVAHEMLEMAKARGILLTPSSSDADVKGRLEASGGIDSAVESVLTSEYATPELKAKVLAVRGDLNLTLAQLPESAWPSSGQTSRTPASFLDAAEKAYKQILTDHADRPNFAIPALLALGSIAESRRDWNEATRYYDMVLKDANARPAHKQLAETRKAILPQLQLALAPIGPATRPASEAATQPAVPLMLQPREIEPTTAPTTAPTR
jgi:hypothetical protein